MGLKILSDSGKAGLALAALGLVIALAAIGYCEEVHPPAGNEAASADELQADEIDGAIDRLIAEHVKLAARVEELETRLAGYKKNSLTLGEGQYKFSASASKFGVGFWLTEATRDGGVSGKSLCAYVDQRAAYYGGYWDTRRKPLVCDFAIGPSEDGTMLQVVDRKAKKPSAVLIKPALLRRITRLDLIEEDILDLFNGMKRTLNDWPDPAIGNEFE